MLTATARVYVYVNKNINSNQHLTHARSKIRVACSARTAILPLCLATPPAVVKLSRTYTQMASNSPLHYSPLLSLLFSQHSAGPSVIHHLCNISRGRYVYMQDLQALSSLPPISSASLDAPIPPLQLLSLISTPLHVHAWATLLNGHPDSEFALFILQGLQQALLNSHPDSGSHFSSCRGCSRASASGFRDLQPSPLSRESETCVQHITTQR